MRNSKLDAKGAPAMRERREATGRVGPRFEVVDGAEEGTRTPTAFRPPAPKAGASANSATSALRNSITRDRQALAADVFAVDAPAAHAITTGRISARVPNSIPFSTESVFPTARRMSENITTPPSVQTPITEAVSTAAEIVKVAGNCARLNCDGADAFRALLFR